MQFTSSSDYSAFSPTSNNVSSIGSICYSSSEVSTSSCSFSSSNVPAVSSFLRSKSSSCSSSVSTFHPNISTLKEEVLNNLKKVIDPDLHKDIVSLKFIQDIKIDYYQNRIEIDLLLTTPACPMKTFFIDSCTKELKKLSWIKNVSIKFVTSSSFYSTTQHNKENLKYVDNIICVSSCKGGVGKSSIAVNLAFMLQILGAKVGILDADIYGPSLHILLRMNNNCVYFGEDNIASEKADNYGEDGPSEYKKRIDTSTKKESECIEKKSHNFMNNNKVKSSTKGLTTKQSLSHKTIEYDHIEAKFKDLQVNSEGKDNVAKLSEGKKKKLFMKPLQYKGVKLMSYAFIKQKKEKGFSAIRGPLMSEIFIEMLLYTFWGKLDYLIIDMPPGTGDIHISLADNLNYNVNIVITTPHTLSVIDVEKGVRMYNQFMIPTIALVENMSYFLCENCNKEHEIFSVGKRVETLIDSFGIPLHIKLPLHPLLSQLSFSKSERNHDCISTKIKEDEKSIYPFALAFNDANTIWLNFKELAENLVREIAAAKFGLRLPKIFIDKDLNLNMTIFNCMTKKFNEEDNTVFELSEEKTYSILCKSVRLSCQCSVCVDELTGQRKVDDCDIDDNIRILEVYRAGNYAVTFYWSDGHFSVIPYKNLENLCEKLGCHVKLQESKCLAMNDLDW